MNRAVFFLGLVICLAALGLHARSLVYTLLLADDFGILVQSYTWKDTCANLWLPINEHSWPLTRLATWALIQVAGRLTALPMVLAVFARLVQMVCMVLVYLFVRRELGHPLPGLVAMALFGISAIYREAIFWFAASPALLALATALLALLAAQRWRQFGSSWDLVSSALWSFLAPGWFGGGILVGPLCCLYLLIPWPKERRWTALVPLMGSLTFLAITLPLAGERILHAEHYGSRNALQAFDLTTALIHTGRSLVDNMFLGSIGIAGFACPPALVVVGLPLLAAALMWWWQRATHHRLLLLGLGFILLNYLLVYGARADWPYVTEDGPGLRFFSRYNVFPQLGLALVVSAGLGGSQVEGLEYSHRLSRRQVRGMVWLIAALFVLQAPHGFFGSPVYDPEQMAVLHRAEDMDARCRANHISAGIARAVLEPLPLPGCGDNVWSFLRGSEDPHPITEAAARQLLNP